MRVADVQKAESSQLSTFRGCFLQQSIQAYVTILWRVPPIAWKYHTAVRVLVPDRQLRLFFTVFFRVPFNHARTSIDI